MNDPNENDGGIILEFIALGNTVKVTAIDEKTGIEAVVLGPVNATRKELSDLAVKKLKYLIDRNPGDDS